MAENSWDYLVRAWVEYWGKRRPSQPITFPENEIVVRGSGFRVGDFTGAVYLNVDPNVYIVLTTSDGNLLQVPGGYNRLEPGFYLRHYVDKRTRTITLPEVITATTLDGAKASITLTISYGATDPVRAMKLSRPVETLFTFIKIDAGEYIKKHTHDQIVSNENAAGTEKDNITQYILQQHSTHHAVNRVFAITDIDPQPWGDQKLMGIRLEDRQSTARLELDHKIQGLEQKIAEKEAEIRKIKAQAGTDIQKIEAQTNAEIQKLKAEAEATIEAQRNELEKQRRAWQHQQELDMSISHVLEKMLTIPGYHPNNQELTLLYNRFSQSAIGVPLTDDSKGKSADEVTGAADPLTKTLLTLLRRKPDA
ncbi:MAG: hypothetical protein AB1846_18675 [Chloroflexota bacterium]